LIKRTRIIIISLFLFVALLFAEAPDTSGHFLNISQSIPSERQNAQQDTLLIPDLFVPPPVPPSKIGDPPRAVIPEDTHLVLYPEALLTRINNPEDKYVLDLQLLFPRQEVRMEDSLIIYEPAENWYGKDSLFFLVSAEDYTDTLVQYITVEPVNDPPVWLPIPVTESLEDELLIRPYDFLYTYVEDVDTPDSLLRFHMFSGTYIHVSGEGGRITVVPDQDWFGDDSIKLTVFDGEFADTTYWHITILPVNDPPVLYELPDIVFLEDHVHYIEKEELHQYAYDVETPVEDLRWQVRSYGRVRAFYDGRRIRLTTPQDWYGTDSLELTVSDEELTASRNWIVHVLPVNDPPVWSEIPRRSFLEDDTLFLSRKELYSWAHDVETPDEELEWTLIPGRNLHIAEEPEGYYIYADPDWYGRTQVRMIVSDGELSDSTRFLLRVIPVNDPPELSQIPPKTWKEDDTLTLTRAYLEQYAFDVETKASDLIWSFIKPPPIHVLESKQEIKIYADPDWNGKERLGVVVFDGGLFDTCFVDLTVIPVNDPPRWLALPDTHIMEDESLIIPLSFIRDHVYDPDEGDTLILTYSSGENMYIEERGDTIILWPDPDWYGMEKLVLTASDGMASSTKVWNIPVLPVNDPPYFTHLMPDSLVFNANETDTLIFKDIVYDIDNELHELVWEITPGRIVRYTFNETIGGVIFYTEGFRHGKDAVTIRVTDGHDMIVYYMPVHVKEVDRFLIANPDQLALHPNSPNPFKEFTEIRYSIPVGGQVSIRVYNLLGKEIKELVNGYHEARNYSVRWFGEDESNMHVPSGVYLCRMVAVIEGEPIVMMRKMMLVR